MKIIRNIANFDNIDKYTVKYMDGRKEWYENDQLHRLDGPAVTRIIAQSDNEIVGISEWWFRGKHIPCSTQEEFDKFLKLKAFW